MHKHKKWIVYLSIDVFQYDGISQLKYTLILFKFQVISFITGDHLYKVYKTINSTGNNLKWEYSWQEERFLVDLSKISRMSNKKASESCLSTKLNINYLKQPV